MRVPSSRSTVAAWLIGSNVSTVACIVPTLANRADFARLADIARPAAKVVGKGGEGMTAEPESSRQGQVGRGVDIESQPWPVAAQRRRAARRVGGRGFVAEARI